MKDLQTIAEWLGGSLGKLHSDLAGKGVELATYTALEQQLQEIKGMKTVASTSGLYETLLQHVKNYMGEMERSLLALPELSGDSVQSAMELLEEVKRHLGKMHDEEAPEGLQGEKAQKLVDEIKAEVKKALEKFAGKLAGLSDLTAGVPPTSL